MTQNDMEEFSRLMTGLFKLFGTERDDAVSELYYDLLQEYPIEMVKESVKDIMRKCKFFPKPAEIIEIIEGSDDERIDFAYQDAKKMLYSDFHFAKRMADKISMQVISDMGGQQEFYNKVYVAGENDTAAYFEFKRLYKIYLKIAHKGMFKSDINYLPGYMNQLPGADPVQMEQLDYWYGGKSISGDELNKMLEGKQLKIGA